MAFGNRETAYYFGTYKGNFTIKANEGEEGAVSRERKDGKTVWEKHFDYIEGNITDIKKESFEWEGKKAWQLKIYLQDEGDTYVVSFPWDSAAAFSFYSQVENINLKDPVKLFLMLSDDRQRLLIKQPTAKSVTEKGFVKSLYNKENPSPSWNPVTFNGETKWDKTEALTFFWNKIQNNVLTEMMEAPKKEEVPAGSMDDDGLPF